MNQRTALVPGASSGIGRALAERLASRGTEVVIVARRVELLDEVKRSIEQKGGKTRVIAADLCDLKQAVDAVDRARDLVGDLDLVVANAGGGAMIPIDRLSWSTAMPILQLNVMAAIATLTSALPQMLKRGVGHLVGVSSLAAMRGLPESAVYCASKAALSMFLEGLRLDLRGSDIAVTDLRPGFVQTPPERSGLPMMMSVETCVDRMVKAIDQKRAVAAFPKPLAWAIAASRALPDALLVRATKR